MAFAKKADVDGLPQLAKLFRATAEAETIHAHAHRGGQMIRFTPVAIL
ncbi:MAG: ferritin family protein [Desulfotignum sp.]|nr:ferritin family protein [Desulfotignum sp.]